jgi:hypothetical protein
MLNAALVASVGLGIAMPLGAAMAPILLLLEDEIKDRSRG